METYTIPLVIAGLAALLVLWNKIKTMLSGNRISTAKEELREVKKDADKKVAEATVSYESFMDKLRKYRNQGSAGGRGPSDNKD